MQIEKLKTLFELERYDDVIKICVENLYTDQDNTYILYHYLIISLFCKKSYDEAQRFVKEAIGLYPSEDLLYAQYARILLGGLNNPKKAEVEIKKALHIDPNDASYYALYAEIYMQMNKHRQAKEMIDKALKIDASELSYHLILASLLWYFDGKKVALEIVDDVLAKDPHNEQALYMKSELFTNTASQKLPILKDLLSRNPMQEYLQKDLKFVQFYYRVIPLSMGVLIPLNLWLHIHSSQFPLLHIIIPIAIFITMLLGSNDWRFNVPFIGIILGTSDYFNNIPNGFEWTDIIAIAILATIYNYFMYGMFALFDRFVLSRILK